MSKSTLLLLAIAVAVPGSINGQTWSAEEQELMAFTQACWDGWRDEEVEPYLDQCWEDDITFWWSEFLLPFGKEWTEQADVWFGVYDMAAFAIQFHKITIHDDVAVINYQMIGVDKGPSGELENWATGRTDVLHRHDGEWKVIAVHQHPVPVT